jgi:3'(2'), 5'-bisphosphate nucleotidase
MEWDTAAAQCVVEQAGGQVTDLTGKRLSYNKSRLLNPYFMVSGTDAFGWQSYLPELDKASS